MKNRLNKKIQSGLFSVACGVLLLGSVTTGLAQSTSTTNTFDAASSTASFVNWWGIGATMTWDGTLDAANDPGSGSVKYVIPYLGAPSEQIMTHFTIANRWGWDAGTVINAVAYTNLSFDIKVDPTSAITPGGNYGYLEIGMTSWVDGTPNDIWTPMNTIGLNIPLSAATSWVHHDIPVNLTWPGIDSVVGFYVKMWSNGAHTNTLTFNLDNVMLTQPTAPVVIPPPTLSLSKATSGLNLINTSSAGANGRQNIHPVNPSYSWVGAANPVAFKITIKDYPVEPTGYQTHLFLAPETSLPYGAGDTSLDWNATNLVFVQIQNTPGGAGQMTFMYKTNFGSGWGGQVFGSNNLGVVNSSVMKGTWTIGFANDTNITLTAPDNTTTNFTMPADSAAMFAGSVFAWVGSQANGNDKVGLSSIIERIEITGFPTDNVNDTFSGPGLDTNVWVNSAADQAGVQVVSASTAYWLNWTVPDVGFSPQSSPVVGAGAVWTDVSAPRALFNAERHVQVTAPSSSAGYFRLIKRVFSQLQVLLPGETNAPNTLTGKVGTPDPVTAGSYITVTINAVDANWNVVSSGSGTINLTSTDPGAIMPLDAGLSGGTLQQIIQLNTAGSWTVTATNISSATIPAATSSSITVN